MTQKEKAEAYDMAIEGVQEILSSGQDSIKMSLLRLRLQGIFPELKESEDEKIRKELIKFVKVNLPDEERYIAWLEKQSKEGYALRSSNEEDVSKLTERITKLAKNYDLNLPNRSYDIYAFAKDLLCWLEKQVEQKPADKVEPKFKVGDWCIDNEDGIIFQLVKVLDHTYRYRTNEGKEYSCTHYSLENDCHLWTIKDAKPGDVLVTDDWVFIFEKLNTNDKPVCYCHYDVELGFFIDVSTYISTGSYIRPATKEQWDALMKAMADAGYTFNFETKELNVVQSESAESDDQETEIPFGAKDSELQEVTYFIPNGFHAEIDDDKVVIKKGESLLSRVRRMKEC